MNPYVTHLESALDGTRFEPDSRVSMHRDRPLWVRYDLTAIRDAVRREELEHRPATMWRFRELLPLDPGAEPVSLGEHETPLLPCRRLGAALGLSQLWIKDESQLPTGSFKSRGLSMAVSMARALGVQSVALPSAGNAGGAAAAYAARAGITAFVFMPQDTPVVNQLECRLYGARTFLVNGLITDCGRIVREGQPHLGWFDLSTLKEPYRLEGKKTMGLELAAQCGWRLPDVIVYPTGGGTGLVGMWKAFEELGQLGWLESTRRPRLVCVQSSGCAPLVRAFHQGERFAAPVAEAQTIARGLRVPSAVGDFMILDAVRATGGTAVAVDEGRLTEWMRLAAASEGLPICPESAACVGAVEQLAAEGWIHPDERVVIFNTGAVQKYVEAMTCPVRHLDRNQPLNWRDLDRDE